MPGDLLEARKLSYMPKAATLRSSRWVLWLFVLGLLLGSCGSADTAKSAVHSQASGEAASARNINSAHPAKARIRVFAAASLTGAFQEMADAFIAAQANTNTEIKVDLIAASSSQLREQILSGAPADVFASANASTMTQLLDGLGDLGEPVDSEAVEFGSNRLVLAVNTNLIDPSAFAEAPWRTLESLSKQHAFGICIEAAPCGQLAKQWLLDLGFSEPESVQISSFEPNAQALATKLKDGELDIALIYQSDLLLAQRQGHFTIEAVSSAGLSELTAYQIVALSDDETTQAFVSFVQSNAGQEILRSYGINDS